MHELIHQLPHVNAALNTLAGLLLVWGYVLIKQGRVIAHRNAMLAAFGASVVFLACYLAHKVGLYMEFGRWNNAFDVKTYGRTIQVVYLSILLPHLLLAATVPFLAGWTIFLGLTDQRNRHNYWAWRTFPIWMFVSITGVIIYVMLYQLYPPMPVVP